METLSSLGRSFWSLPGEALPSLRAAGLHAEVQLRAEPVPDPRVEQETPVTRCLQAVVLVESLLTLALVNKEKPKLLLR